MSLALDRPEFAPPPQRGTTRAVVFALIAHALLIAALTWGVRWKNEGDDDAVEAELWSATQQVAAPRIATPPPAPEPTPAPPPPPPPPPPQAAKPPPEPVATPKAPDIALEREKKLREEQEERERELEQQREQEKRRQDAQARKEKEKKEQLEAEKREEAERQKEQQQQQQKLAEQKKREDAKRAEAQKAQLEKDRQDNLRRLMGQAGSTAEQTTGPRSGKGAGSGTSSGYFGRVAALIKRNVVFDPNSVSGNPAAEIQIQTSPDGTIVGTPRLVKSSGNPAWDEAAMRAVQKTEVMPRDIDGRVPSPFPIINLRPKQQ